MTNEKKPEGTTMKLTTSGDDSNIKVQTVVVSICDACIDGEGQECHTPGCALFLHSVDLPIHRELLLDATPLLSFVRELSEEPCAYGDGCPKGARHGMCLHCRARKAQTLSEVFLRNSPFLKEQQ
jgi:hypothetical protein